jgi:hypothetical protein
MMDVSRQGMNAVSEGKVDTEMALRICESITRFMDRWVTAVEPQIFLALALLEDTPLEDGVMDVMKDLDAINNKVIQGMNDVFVTGQRRDKAALKDAWTQLVERRQAHLDLAREHFRPRLDDAEQAALRRHR